MKRMFFLSIFVLLLISSVSASTYLFYTANSTDGALYNNTRNATFSYLHDSPSGNSPIMSSTYHDVRIYSDLESGKFQEILRLFTIFDTSSIDDSETVTSANLSIYKRSTATTDLGDAGIGITKFNIDGTITSDDYNNFDDTLFAGYKNISTFTGIQYYSFPFNALGISNISKTGNTGLGVRTQWDIENYSPTWQSLKISRISVYVADYVLYPPILTVETEMEEPTPTPAPTTAADDYPICGDMNFFFWNDSSSFGTDYNRLATKPQLSDAVILSTNVSSSTGEKTIGSFITEPFPTGKIMGPGLTRYRTYLNVSSSVGITKFDFIPYNVSPGGTETRMFFGVPRTEEINSLTADEYLTSYARRNYTYFLPGERLLIRVNASTTSTVARDAYFNIVGTEAASMVQVGYWICPDPVIPGREINPASPDSFIGTAKLWIKKFLKDVFE